MRVIGVSALVLALVLADAGFGIPRAQRFDGFNVISVPGHPFGGDSARRALADARRIGAGTVAIVPFLWQERPSEPDVVRGSDMTDEMLRAAIRDARALGFTVLVKPHVWIPGSWAGAVRMADDDGWRRWFASYGRALAAIARVAEEEEADALAIGTELAETSHRSEWLGLIALARERFHRTLFYVAHNADEAERVPFWNKLDAIGVSLYPPLGADHDRTRRRAVMRTTADRVDMLAQRIGKPVIVGEIGLRSARGAAAKPWESAEERMAAPDPLLQAEVLADWLATLRRPAIRGVLIWRWFSDPDAGGDGDTDFTVQGKIAQGVLLCAWTPGCSER